MPTLEVTNFNVRMSDPSTVGNTVLIQCCAQIVCSVLGGFITLFGLVSYLFKEKFYLSEARAYIHLRIFILGVI